jgi:hypothetical protein
VDPLRISRNDLRKRNVVMSKSPKQLLFVVWGWLAVPWTLAAIAVGFWYHPFAGVGLAVLALLWLLNMGQTTCSRCSSYNTGRCGVQSWVVPLFWAKKSMKTVSPFRVRLNMAFDVLMMAVNGVVLAFVPMILPVYLAWVVLGWFVVYGPKQNHGLQPLLRAEERKEASRRVSLTVLSTTTGESHECGSGGCGSRSG